MVWQASMFLLTSTPWCVLFVPSLSLFLCFVLPAMCGFLVSGFASSPSHTCYSSSNQLHRYSAVVKPALSPYLLSPLMWYSFVGTFPILPLSPLQVHLPGNTPARHFQLHSPRLVWSGPQPASKPSLAPSTLHLTCPNHTGPSCQLLPQLSRYPHFPSRFKIKLLLVCSCMSALDGHLLWAREMSLHHFFFFYRPSWSPQDEPLQLAWFYLLCQKHTRHFIKTFNTFEFL